MTHSSSSSSSFKIIEVCSVEPLNGTTISSTVPNSLTLTFFDLLWLRFPPVERLFFFSFPHSSSVFFDSVLPNLKHSLSLTLPHFLPLAGNLTWSRDSPRPSLTYLPGDSVSFTVSESHTGNFNTLCSNLCEALQRETLIAKLNNSDEKSSVLALQVTIFHKNGFCIGITTHHAIFDGKSSTSFMKAWAYTCSKLHESPSLTSLSLPENLIPVFDRSVIKDPTGLGEIYADAWLNHGGTDNRSLKVWDSIHNIQSDSIKGLFELTSSQIGKLKLYALSKMKTKMFQPSTFAVTTAYVLTCLVKAEQPKDERTYSKDRVWILQFPEMYFGNCVSGAGFRFDPRDLMGNDGFITALDGISEALNRAKDQVLDDAKYWITSMLKAGENGGGGRKYSIAGSPRFGVYGINFGWGKPKKVDITSTDRTGAFSISESKNDSGGIEIGLALKKCEMEAFSTHFVQGLESL